MSKIEQMEAELRKLSQPELRQIRAWLDTSSWMSWNSPRSLNGLSSNRNRTWLKVEPHACARRIKNACSMLAAGATRLLLRLVRVLQVLQ